MSQKKQQYPWFRMYHEARNDAKLRALTDAQHRVWFNLLCFAAEQRTQRGTIPAYPDDLLAIEVSGGDVELLHETLERLDSLRIVTCDDGAITFSHFLDRQYDNPSDYPDAVAERVRRSREKQQPDPDDGAPVTPPKRVKRHVTTRNEKKRLREDTDKEEKDTSPPKIDAKEEGNISPLPATSAHASSRLRAINPLWDELVAQFYEPEGDLERGRFGKAVYHLKKLGATVEDVRLRCERHRDSDYHWTLTPLALVGHWGELAQEHVNGTAATSASATGTHGGGSRGRARAGAAPPPPPDPHNHGIYADFIKRD